MPIGCMAFGVPEKSRTTHELKKILTPFRLIFDQNVWGKYVGVLDFGRGLVAEEKISADGLNKSNYDDDIPF